jgi:hypothetical protein
MTLVFAKSSLNAFPIPASRGVRMASSNRMTEAKQMAQTLGIVVGAASCCEEVTEERVSSVTTKLRQLVSAAAGDTADADAADREFSAALEAGKTAVESGRIDPHYAEAALVELEQQLST